MAKWSIPPNPPMPTRNIATPPTRPNCGLLLVAFLLLALTIIRYWHNIHWSWR